MKLYVFNEILSRSSNIRNFLKLLSNMYYENYIEHECVLTYCAGINNLGNHNTNLNARANINDRIRLIGIAYEASNLIFPSIEEETNRLRLSVWR